MTEPTAEANAAPRRGRPRPESTIQRDEQVFQALVAGGKTREDLATETGLTKSEVYLSLHRLRNAGKVERTRDSGKHVWAHVAEQTPTV